jgi:serine protease AprX
LLKTLRISASNYNSPNNAIGWGIPNVCSFVLGLNNKSADLAIDELMVYPNPFNSLISIYLNSSNEKIISISLNDMLGKTLQTFDANSNDFTLDLSNCDSGIYFLRIETDSKVLSKKIIKQ